MNISQIETVKRSQNMYYDSINKKYISFDLGRSSSHNYGIMKQECPLYITKFDRETFKLKETYSVIEYSIITCGENLKDVHYRWREGKTKAQLMLVKDYEINKLAHNRVVSFTPGKNAAIKAAEEHFGELIKRTYTQLEINIDNYYRFISNIQKGDL